MKKALASLLLVALVVLAFTGCVTAQAASQPTGLDNARGYLYAMYKDKAIATPSDYQVVGALNINGVAYALDWAVEGASEADVKLSLTDKKMVNVDVNEKASAEVNYTLVATITDSEGKTETLSFAHSIPAYKEFTWDEYVAAANGSTVVVKGTITGIMAKSKGNSANCLYFEDSDGGYYAYNLANDPVTELGLNVGMTVRVTGSKDTYSGTYEIISASVEVLDPGFKAISPLDVTDLYLAATSLKDPALVKRQSALVSVKGVEITGQDVGGGYYKFKLGSLESYVRISSSVCPLVKADQTAFIAGHTNHFGWIADVTGVLCVYDGAFYLTPVTVDAYNYVSLPAKSDAEMVAFEKENLAIASAVAQDTVIDLPLNGQSYSQVAISWASDNACAVVKDGKLYVTLPEEEAKVNLTATITCAAVTETRTFQIAVDSAVADLFIASKVTNPQADVAYKYALVQANLGKTLYFTGAMSGNYLGTTDKPENAVDVYREDAEGGYNMYFLADGVKTYIEIYEYTAGKVGVHFTAEPKNVFVWNAELEAPVVNILDTQYYLGTYKTYNTISASAIKYVTGDNAKNVGVSQFPCFVAELSLAQYKSEMTSAPKAGVSYTFALEQASLGKKLYFSGKMSGNYLGTTDKLANAATVQFEEAEGGMFMYFMADGAKTYVEIYEYTSGKVGVHFTSEPKNVFVWNADINAPVVNLLDTQYYLGTYKTYDTISASAIKYVTGDNAKNVGVSQFPAHVFTDTLTAIAVEPETNPQLGTAYKYALEQASLGQKLYFNGKMDGKYLGTTAMLAKAADVYREDAEGGYNMYFLVDGVKTYIEIYEYTAGKVGVQLTAAPKNVFVWNAELNAPVVNLLDTQYYLGTYKTYSTISASAIKYVTGDNAKNVGVSQFPAQVYSVKFVD
jgi:hypothetical protein